MGACFTNNARSYERDSKSRESSMEKANSYFELLIEYIFIFYYVLVEWVRALHVSCKDDFISLIESFSKGHKDIKDGKTYLFRTPTFNFFYESDNLFEIAPNLELKIKSEKRKHDILDSLDLSGASDLETTILPLAREARFQTRKTKDSNWAGWFSKIAGTTENKTKYLVPDTNFFMRHYCSNVILPLYGKSNFSQLDFRIPNLVILEIERICNKAEKGSKEKRLAFYATNEIMFLRNHGAELLPPIDVSLLASFPEKAGRGFTDMWIRREIHNFVIERAHFVSMTSQQYPEDVLFLTCDLMNALAAHAEGLETCYFSKLDQERFIIENDQQLAKFIIASAVTFGKIKMDVYYVKDKLDHSYELEGIWSGKNPYHWRNDCLRISS